MDKGQFCNASEGDEKTEKILQSQAAAVVKLSVKPNTPDSVQSLKLFSLP